MGSPISPGEVIEIISKGIELYKKVKDCPEQIKKIGKRMPRLRTYLLELQELVDVKKHPRGLAALRPEQVARINEILADVEEDAKEVNALLRKWHRNEGPGGLQLKFDWVAHAIYALGSSPDKLEALVDSIDVHKHDINFFVVLLSAYANNAFLKAGNAPKSEKKKEKSPSPSPAKGKGENADKTKAPPSPTPKPKQKKDEAKDTDSNKNNPKPKPSPSPSRSPSPAPPPRRPPPQERKNLNIAFVDGYNVGRARIAEGYMRLLQESSANNSSTDPTDTFPFHKAHSLGLNLTGLPGCSKELLDMGLKTIPGGALPNPIALDALFDNKLFSKVPAKHLIRTVVAQRKAVGVPRDVFQFYDLVVCFTKTQEVRLYKLRDALEKSGVNKIRGKGRIVMLGDYLGEKNATQIFEPEGVKADRQAWNAAAGVIKRSIKAMLKKETGWRPLWEKKKG